MRTERDEAAAVRASAASLYADGQRVWDLSDRWNKLKRQRIDRFCRKQLRRHSIPLQQVLDVGAGNDGYDWIPTHAIRVDRFINQVTSYPTAVVGDVEQLPFRSGTFDTTICVGSVINYASAVEAVAELMRVTGVGGWLILHFESSASFEHVGTSRWRASASPLDTINSSRDDHIWIYSPELIRSSIKANGGAVVEARAFHILSSLGLRIGLSQPQAAWLASLDGMSGLLTAFADDVIFLVEKTR